MNKQKRFALLLWGDFRLWLGAPRTLWMICAMLLLCVLQVVRAWQGPLQEHPLNALELIVFHFYDGFNLMMSSSIFLLGCSEIPKRMAWQQQSLIRSSRRAWLMAYIGQCIMMVVMTVALMILSTWLLSIGPMQPGSSWSDLERIEKMEILPSDSVIAPFLLENATPLQAAAMCLAPLCLFWFTMLLIILLFGMTSKPSLGLLLCAFAVLSYVCLMVDSGWLGYFALYRYTRLSGMNLEYNGMAYFGKVLLGYAAIDLGLITGMMILVKRAELAFSANAMV